MLASENLSRRLRGFIVLVALLQGLLMYLAELGHEQAWWPLATLGGRVCWYTLVLAVPTAMLLTVQRLDDPRFWQHVAGITGVYALLAWWAAWSATGAPGIDSSNVLGPFGVTLGLGLFVALPYLQCRLAHGRWRAPYPELFEHAWQNALTIALTGLFIGICWLVLELWAALFSLVKIDFFRDLFHERPFAYLATGTMAGLGLLIARTQQRPLHIARQLLFAIFRGLLPLVALIALLFLASLPFTGLAPLWATRSAAAILMGLLLLLVLLTNAVYQDGRGGYPYPLFLRRLVEAGLLAAPVYAALGLYALSLRIGQYGWTPDRFWAVLAAIIVSAYACGYFYTVLRRGSGWLDSLPRVNIVVSLAVMALVALANSPVLDPFRITVASQTDRLHAGKVAAKDVDVEQLRFDSGRRGYIAAEALQTEPLFAADADALAKLRRVLARSARYVPHDASEQKRLAVKDLASARALIHPVAGSAIPDDDWLRALQAGTLQAGGCLMPGSDCVFIERDLNGDGRNDRLLCDLGLSWGIVCNLSSQGSDGAWRQTGTARWTNSNDVEKQRKELRAGQLEIRQPAWPDLLLGGVEAHVDTP